MQSSRVLAFGLFAALISTAVASDQQGVRGGLSGLPKAAEPTISAALGRDIAAYAARREPSGIQADNIQQHLHSTFTREDVEVRSGSADWHIRLESYGYGSTLTPVARTVPDAEGNRVQYRHENLTEWYINGPVGLEQGFTIKQPPGKSHGRELTLKLAFSGARAAFHDDQQVVLKDTAGKSQLRYSGLEAHDSSGRDLMARIEVDGQHLRLRVDDRDAKYPIIVDPWVQTSELAASDGGAGDQFGWSVSISGNTVVVGAPFHALGGNSAQGAAYVFVEPANGWTSMTQTAELAASDGAANAFFGSSVAISGNTIIVGSDGANIQGNPHQGAAYVFVEPANGWTNMTQTAELAASDGYIGDDFGASVAISGNTLVVGAPYASVGANSQQGASYIFVEPGGGWANMNQTAKLTSSDGASNDIFGDSVAINGSTVVVGASGATLNGNADAGKAYIFVQPGSGWADMTQTAELTASDATSDNYFGSSVAIDGNTAVVGAPSDFSGAAYIFVQPSNGWTDATQDAELTPGSVATMLLMGTSVGLNGTTVMAGAVGATINGNADQGLMYVFLEPIQVNGWSDQNQSGELISSDGGAGDYFGRSLSLGDNAEVIGAPFHQVGPNDEQGAAYVFQPLNSRPTETSLSPSSSTAGGPGFQLTVGGTNFVQGAIVNWNNSPRSTTFVSASQVQAQILSSDIAKVGNFLVTTTNPAPGGGKSNHLTFTVNNPAPGILSLSPDQALAGGPGFTLTVNGSNFVSNSKVQWNGTTLSSTFVSNVMLTAIVPARAIQTGGTASVTVVNPAPGGGTSNAETFYINNPVPSLTSLSPSSTKAGSPAFTLNILGTGFVNTSQAMWNGSKRTTTYVGPRKVQAAILASDVAKAGTAQVTVANPSPGGGNSNSLTFTINK